MKVINGLLIVAISVLSICAQVPQLTEKDYIKVAPQNSEGFAYPYYYYVPAELKAAAKKQHTILVLPNNTGKPDDDLAFHENDVKKRMSMAGAVAASLKVAVLMPVFPRPQSDWRIYTQALDRDSMLTDKAEYRRLDLQLVAMIDDLRDRLKKGGLKLDKRVLINGFSAQGMFANRFTFLHPDRVKAAAIGSPGGWPIAPVERYKDKDLRYPIGIADLKKVAGKTLDLNAVRKVPLFIFVGDQDTNDSVPFDDSYDQEDRDLINPLLGKTPVERFPVSESLYKEAGLNATFRIYPGVAHTVNAQMREDIRAFLLKYAD